MPSRKSPLSIKWTSHLKDKEAKAKFELTLRNSLHQDPVIKRLKEIISSMEEDTISSSSSKEEIDTNPNWALKQAYNAGALNTLKHISKDLLTLKDPF